MAMCSCLRDNPVGAEGHRRPAALGLGLRYGLLALVSAGLTLVGLQLLLGRQLAQQQRNQLVAGVSANLLLGAVALERFSPEALAELSGMHLAEGPLPPPGHEPRWPAIDPGALQQQTISLRRDLCRRLDPCPQVLAGRGDPRGLWVQMESPLEQVWLFVPLPPTGLWPPDPGLLSLSLGIGGLGAGLLFQLLEVQRPLRQLQRALGQVGLEAGATPVRERGSGAVRQLSRRFNAMLDRLTSAEQERRTMLAGIAHDLRAPLTRLRLRLRLAGDGASSGGEHLDPGRSGTRVSWTVAALGQPEAASMGAEADLDALERITGQFLLFAGAEDQEAPVRLPLQDLLAETAALVGSVPLTLDLEPLERCVRPICLGRAVANLLENALEHGKAPLRLVLRPWSTAGQDDDPGQEGFAIQVWDQGAGIAEDDWPRALTPFLRLDPARSGRGHCGLGLAIAARIARDHGGGLERLQNGNGFAVVLQGLSLPRP
jgi:two-component system, OmpR family, osmolarity sensor histidine kinase EnvZ